MFCLGYLVKPNSRRFWGAQTVPGAARYFTSSRFLSSQNQVATREGLTARTTGILSTLIDSGASRQDRRLALSRAVTLIESTEARRKEQASILLQAISDASLAGTFSDSSPPSASGGAFRVGFAGPPGAGKSSFIEKFGLHVLGADADGKPTRSLASEPSGGVTFSPSTMAVLSIDPSSSYSGGSILGDKTRMPELSRHPDCFIRPSPTSTNLGGINAYTNDVIQLCQAGGYGLVVVETVGVGQSEVEVDKAVDMLILLVPPGGGDELQGVKKGIVEVADMLIVNKADGALLTTARHTCADYRGAVKWQGRGKSDIREGWKGENLKQICLNLICSLRLFSIKPLLSLLCSPLRHLDRIARRSSGVDGQCQGEHRCGQGLGAGYEVQGGAVKERRLGREEKTAGEVLDVEAGTGNHKAQDGERRRLKGKGEYA